MQSRRQFLKTSFVASLGLSSVPRTYAEAIGMKAAPAYTKMVDQVILVQDESWGNIRKVTVKKEVEDKDPFRVQAGREQKRKEVIVHAKINSLADRLVTMPQEQRADALKNFDRQLFKDGDINSLNGADIAALSAEMKKYKEESSFEKPLAFVSGVLGAGSAALGFGAWMTAEEAAPIAGWLGLGSAGFATASAYVDDFIEPEYKRDVNTDSLVSMMHHISRKGGREKLKSLTPEERKQIKKQLEDMGVDGSYLDDEPDLKKLPKHLQKPAKKILEAEKAGRDLSSEEENEIAKDIQDGLSDSFKDAFTDSKPAEGKDSKEEKKLTPEEEYEQRVKEARTAKEIESGVYLAGFIAGKIFKNPEVGGAINKIYNSYSIVSNVITQWNKDPRLIDCLTVAADFTKAFELLGSIVFGQKDATQQALENIQKTLDKIRQEMHERFDEVVKNQVKILDKLGEIEGKVENINIKLQELYAAHNINDGDGRVRDAERYIKERKEAVKALNNEKRYVKSNLFSPDRVKDAIEKLSLYASDTSAYNPFTRSDAERFTNVRRDWDPAYVRNLFRAGGINLNYMVGYIPTVYTHIGAGADIKPLRNVDLFVDATNDIAQAYPGFPALSKDVIDPEVEILGKIGAEVQKDYSHVFNRNALNALKQKIEESFAAFIRVKIDKALASLNADTTTGKTVPEFGTIYPFAQPDMQRIVDGGAMPGREYRGFRVSYFKPERRQVTDGSIRVESIVAGLYNSPNLGERVKMSQHALNYAESYGLISLTADNKGEIDRKVSHGYLRTTYHLKFLKGDAEGKEIKYVRYFRHPEKPDFKECCIDAPLNKLAIGDKYFSDAVHRSGLHHSDGDAFERYIYQQTNTQHGRVRDLYLGALRKELAAVTDVSSLQQSLKSGKITDENEIKRTEIILKSEEAKLEFEALTSSLGYIGGLSMQMRGRHPQLCADFVKKAHESLLGDAESIYETVLQVLKAEVKDKDPELKKIDNLTIRDYLENALKYKLSKKLDRFINEHIPEQGHGVETLQFKAARKILNDLPLQPNIQQQAVLEK